MKINITRALRIPGWMNPSELRWLARQAMHYQCIVEVGSYLGRSTRALGDHAAGVVYALDDWYGPRGVGDYKPTPRGSGSLLGQRWTPEERAALYEQFSSNLRDLIEARKVIPLKIDHRTTPPNIFPDMVFIDGDHSYQSVAADIDAWWPRLARGGLISGHDSDQAGVMRAVRERWPGENQVKISPLTTIWAVKK